MERLERALSTALKGSVSQLNSDFFLSPLCSKCIV